MFELEEFKTKELPQSIEELSLNDFEYLYATEGLSPNDWERLTVQERLDTLQMLECKLAEIQGRKPVPVVVANIPGENGHYDPITRSITLNPTRLGDSKFRLNLVDTIAHEGRHAYQHYAIEHAGFHPKEDEVKVWRENMKPGNYIDGKKEGLLAYRLQPVEADAWRYGHFVRDAISFADMDAEKKTMT